MHTAKHSTAYTFNSERGLNTKNTEKVSNITAYGAEKHSNIVLEVV